MLTVNYVTLPANAEDAETTIDEGDNLANENEKVLALKNFDDNDPDEYNIHNAQPKPDKAKKVNKQPCVMRKMR